MYRVLERIAEWNASRYDRVIDMDLTCRLLREEHKEWLTAKTPVDKLDALCDIIFVAVGAIWKGNIDIKARFSAQLQAETIVDKLIQQDELWPAYFIGTYIDVLEYDPGYPYVMSMHLCITAALAEMTGLGLDHTQCVEALNIVCDSNYTKTIVRLGAGDKGNLKGLNFVAPEPRLAKLLEKARGKLN